MHIPFSFSKVIIYKWFEVDFDLNMGGFVQCSTRNNHSYKRLKLIRRYLFVTFEKLIKGSHSGEPITSSIMFLRLCMLIVDQQ